MRRQSILLRVFIPLTLVGAFFAASSVSASGSNELDDAEFIPYALHASRSANYATDTSGVFMAPLDAGIIMDILELRNMSADDAQAIYQDVQSAAASPNQEAIADDDDQPSVERSFETQPNSQITSSSKQSPETPAEESNGESNGNGNSKKEDNKEAGNNGNGNGNSKKDDQGTGNNGKGNDNGGAGNGNGKGNNKEK